MRRMPRDQYRLLGYSVAAAVVIVLTCWACGALQSLAQHLTAINTLP